MFSFSENLSKLLAERGLTQKELAMLIGTTEATISRYINAERAPNAELVARMAKVLNTTSDYLLGNTNDPTSIDRLTRLVEEARKAAAAQKYLNEQPKNKPFDEDDSSALYAREEDTPLIRHHHRSANRNTDILEVLQTDQKKRATCEMLLKLPDSDIEKVETFIKYLISLQKEE